MAVLATDTFTRADNLDLGTDWDVPTGGSAFQLLNNAAAPRNPDTDAVESNNSATWPNDQYAQCAATVSGTTSTAGPGPAVRIATGALTLYRCVVSHAASNNVELAKIVSGTYTQLALRTQAWTDGDVLRLEVAGTTLKVFRNGTQMGANVTDSSIASGRAGIGFSSVTTSASLDNWEGGDFTTAAPPGHAATGMTPAVQRAAFW